MASPSGGRCILLLLGRRGVLWQLVGRGVGGRQETNGAIDGCCILPSDEGKRKKVELQHIGLSWVGIAGGLRWPLVCGVLAPGSFWPVCGLWG